jgi:hypothetical protein
LGAAASVGVITLAFTQNAVIGFFLLVFLTLALYISYRMMHYVTYTAGRRLLELEDEINKLAEEKLLRWEREHGIFSGSNQCRVASVMDPIKDGYRRCRVMLGLVDPSN